MEKNKSYATNTRLGGKANYSGVTSKEEKETFQFWILSWTYQLMEIVKILHYLSVWNDNSMKVISRCFSI